MPIYEAKGRKFNIPDDIVEEFLADVPYAKLMHKTTDGGFVEVPMPNGQTPDRPKTETETVATNGVAAPGAALIENAYVEGFVPGVKQGTKSLYEGGKVAVGNTANVVTGSSRDAVKALDILDRHGAESYDPSKARYQDVQDKYQSDMDAYKKDLEAWHKANPGILDKLKGMLPFVGDMPEEPKNPNLIEPNIADIMSGVGTKVDSRPYKLVSEALEKGDIEAAKAYLQELSKQETWGDRVESKAIQELSTIKPTKGTSAWIGNMIPQMIPNALAIGASAHPLTRPLAKPLGGIGMGVLSAASAGSAIAEARQYAAEHNLNIPESDIQKAGVLSFGIELGTEAIPFGRYMSRAGNLTKRVVGGKITRDIIENPNARREMNNLFERAAGGFNGVNKETGKAFLKDITAEGLSEFSAESLGAMVPMIYANKEDYPSLYEILQNGLEGAKAGVFMGGILGGGSIAVGNHVQNKRRKEQGKVTLLDTESGIVEYIGENGDNITVLDKSGEVSEMPKSSVKDVQTVTYEEFKNYAKGQKVERTEQAVENITKAVDAEVNPSTGTIMSARLGNGGNAPEVTIVKGNIVLNENGTIDRDQSDREIYYRDENGEVQIATINHIWDVTENVPRDEAINQIATTVINEVSAEIENEDALFSQSLNEGDVAYYNDPTTGTLSEVHIEDITEENGIIRYSAINEYGDMVSLEPRFITASIEEAYSSVSSEELQRNIDMFNAALESNAASKDQVLTPEQALQIYNQRALMESELLRRQNVNTENHTSGSALEQSPGNQPLTENSTPAQSERDNATQEATETEQQPDPFAGFPRNKKGEIDIDNLNAEQQLQYAEQTIGEDFAVQQASRSIKGLKKRRENLEKKLENETNLAKAASVQSEINQINDSVKLYEEYQSARNYRESDEERSTPSIKTQSYIETQTSKKSEDSSLSQVKPLYVEKDNTYSSDSQTNERGNILGEEIEIEEDAAMDRATEEADARLRYSEINSSAFMSEAEYVDSRISDYIEKNRLTREDFDNLETSANLENEFLDSYIDYINQLKGDGVLQQMYNNSTIGEEIKIRKNVESAGFDVDELIDTSVKKKQRRAQDKEKKDQNSLYQRLKDAGMITLQNTQERFKPISEKKLNKLVDRLKKTRLAKDVIVDKQKMQDTLERILGKENAARFMVLWHGSPHDFDKFSLSYMGTGEGNQSFGWGLYFSDSKDVADYYASQLSNPRNELMYKGRPASDIEKSAYSLLMIDDAKSIDNTIKKAEMVRDMLKGETETQKSYDDIISILQNSKESDFEEVQTSAGAIYKTNASDDSAFMSWDEQVEDEQIASIKENAKKEGLIDRWGRNVNDEGYYPNSIPFSKKITGDQVYNQLMHEFNMSPKEASLFLLRSGISGIRYPSGTMSGIESDSFNYVVFDENILEVKDKIRLMSDNGGIVYGFVTPDGTIYLNKDRMNANTPIHEFGHLWNSFIKDNNPELHARGAELIEQSEYWQKVNDNPAYAGLSKEAKIDEALAMAIGDKGELIENRSLKEKFMDWLFELWGSVRSAFGQSADINVQDMTLDQFTDLAVGELLSEDDIFYSQIKKAKEKIKRVLNADKDTSKRTHEVLFPVSSTMSGRIKELTGLDISGYNYSIDKSDVNHAINRHSNKKIEESRGQLPLSEDDILRLPEVVNTPDNVRSLGKDKLGRETIEFSKQFEDGNVIVYEAVLTKRKELAFQTMFKKKSSEFMQESPTPTPETTSEFQGKDNTLSTENQISKQEISEMEQIKEASIADGSFMKAPNGKDTNLNERQWLQTRTTNFKNWFGDWQNNPKNASKVLDENGEPLVVYHISNPTQSFIENSIVDRRQWDGSQMWFTANKDIIDANKNAGREDSMYPVFLKINNPSYEKYYQKDSGAFIDGVIERDVDGSIGNAIIDIYNSSNQVKSATENTGAFDPKNLDIRYQAEDANNTDKSKITPINAEEILARNNGDVLAAIGEMHKLHQIRAAEAETNTNPTEAQKDAGNYKKGHVRVNGFDISIEQPKGSIRSGTDENGNKWETEMKNTYGYIRGTESRDGDHIDVFLGDNLNSDKVFIVDQVNPETLEFDEHKVMMGFDTIEDARAAYLSNYEDGWNGLGDIVEADVQSFRKWAELDGRRMKPFSEYGNNGVRFQVEPGSANTKVEIENETPPIIREGESVINYAKRVADWWQKKSKDIEQITKELNKSKVKLAELRMERNRIENSLKGIKETSSNKTDRIKRIQATAKKLEDYIYKNINDELVDWMGIGEFRSLMSKLRNPASKKDVEAAIVAVDKTINNIETRRNKKTLEALLRTKVLDKNQKGVSVAKNVDDDTRRSVEYIRKNRELSQTEIDERIKVISERTEEEDISPEDMRELSDLEIVRLLSHINVAQNNLNQIDEDIRNSTNKQEVDALQKERLEYQSDLNKVYENAIKELNDLISTGKSKLAEIVQKDINRKRKIGKEAIEAISSKPIRNQAEEKEKSQMDKFKEYMNENKLKELLLSPQGSFNFMLKFIDHNHPMGEGRLYNRFMKSNEGVFVANDNYYNGERQFREEIKAKAEEIFGRKFKNVIKDSRRDSGIRLEYTSRNGDIISIKMTNGELLYVYMVSKMTDGASKLERMGITDLAIGQIRDALGKDYIQFSDWVQGEFLPNKRKKYNETHKKLFGTSMAKRENYFPLQYNRKDIRDNVELGDMNKGDFLPTTMTGNIINRVRNNNDIDLNANAFDVLMEHGQKMEEWNAYAPVRKDLNGLLSNRHVRNLIEANHKGSFQKFKESAAIATRSYNTKADRTATIVSNINRRFAGGAIAFRINTAIKQLLSFPAFFEYSSNPKYTARLIRNLSPDVWVSNFRWATKELPGFAERWESGNIGMDKLVKERWVNSDKAKSLIGKFLDGYTNVGMWPNRLIDAFTVVAGSKSIYDFAKANYIKNGMSETEAENMAKVDAGIAYNETQQSARPEFLAPVQTSGDVINRSLSTFMNNNFAYLRKFSEGVDQLFRKAQPQIKQLTKENVESGMSEADAEEEAKRVVYGSRWKASKKILLSGFFLPMIWELTEKIRYGLWDDDREKEKDVLTSIATAPISGLYGGSMISSLAKGYKLGNPMIMLSEGERRWNEISKSYTNNGFFSPAVGLAVSKVLLQGGGINYDTWYNMYTAAEQAIKDGEWDSNNTFYLLNAPASVRKSYASKYQGEDVLAHIEKISDAYNRELETKELKPAIQKVLFSDNGNMTRFNQAYELAKEWKKLKSEAANDKKSERYNELRAIGDMLTDFYDYVESNTKFYRDYVKEGEVKPKIEDDISEIRNKSGAYIESILQGI